MGKNQGPEKPQGISFERIVTMRVLFYSHDAFLYGASRSLLNVIEGLKTHGVDSHVVLPYGGPLENELQEKQIPYKILPHSWWVSRIKPPSNSISLYYKWLKDIKLRTTINIRALYSHLKYVKSLNPDIIYTNTSVIPMGAIVSFLLKKKHVWHLREFKEIDYGMYLDFGNGFFKLLIHRSDAVILISHALRTYYSNALNSTKSFVVHNGIAFQYEFDKNIQTKKKIDVTTSPYTFGIVGYLLESKGQHIAIKALSLLKDRYPDIKLIVAGSGDLNRLKKMITDLKLENHVDLVGFVKNPYEIYYAIDACLMCSRNEAFGRVTVEAMSAALPVIGNDRAGTSEIIQHEHTGLLYKGSQEELAHAMERFIQDPSWAKQLGRNGWNVARENFNIERNADDIYRILQSVHQKNVSA